MNSRLFLLAPFLCAAPASAQQVLQTITTFSGDELGAAVIEAGDQNGDGWTDLLVGAPGVGVDKGAVHCISGRYFATGTLPSFLWSISTPPVNFGARFGESLVKVGQLTGDATPDFVVGAPDYVPPGAFDVRGAIFLVDGSTHAIVAFIEGMPLTHFGQALAAVGDQTGDFKPDIAVSAPEVSTSIGSTVHIVPGAAFGFSTAIAAIPHSSKTSSWHGWGAALASGFDLELDGKFDLAVSIPEYGTSFPEAGYVEVCRATDFSVIGSHTPNVAGEHFGASLDASTDYNGDVQFDLVVGAPNWSPIAGAQEGRVVVLSGRKLVLPGSPEPLEVFTFFGPSGLTPTTAHFGARVHAGRDLNGDGVGDILVGAPEYHTTSFPFGPDKGAVLVFSGATGARLASVFGANNDKLGDALTTMDDVDGDGFREFLVAGSLSDNPSFDCGVLKGVRLFPATPSIYCTGKTNSLGCVPAMSWSGSPSASAAAVFDVKCTNVINQKVGFLMYSHAPNAAPFQGGKLCVKPPQRRTANQNSGGSASGSDCSGTFAFDFNARIQSGVDASLVAGAEVFGQYWSRDPGVASTTSLSNALRFLINP